MARLIRALAQTQLPITRHRRIARADSILVAKEIGERPTRNGGQKYSSLFSEKAARAADHSFGDLMELAGSRCGHPLPHHRLDLLPRCSDPGPINCLQTQLIASHVRSLMAKPPHGRRFSDHTHRQTLAGCQARFRASGGRFFTEGVSFSRWPP